LVGVLERRGARRPCGTFAEALFAVPPFGGGPVGRRTVTLVRKAMVSVTADTAGAVSAYGYDQQDYVVV
jgi:hypothetical protein